MSEIIIRLSARSPALGPLGRRGPRAVGPSGPSGLGLQCRALILLPANVMVYLCTIMHYSRPSTIFKAISTMVEMTPSEKIIVDTLFIYGR